MAKPRILYIDDEKANLFNFEATFDDEYQILTALSGEEGLDIIEQEGEMAIVISDQRMPGLSGVDTLTEVRKRHPGTMRILITAYTDPSELAAAIKQGNIYCSIAKPWNETELRMTLKQCLKSYQLARKPKMLPHKPATKRIMNLSG